ncbi:MAG: low specificity L-threonine aldolase [Clostridia bacterium]|nr:low specificity L-threonine aldolase [Clostridia bacterium]
MKKLSFECDYRTGAHPEILRKFIETNMESLDPYGTDSYSESAEEKIKTACGDADIDVFFLSGGTQTNLIVISSLLKSYEGVIAADTGHISIHEAGAIEYHGHKVLSLPHKDGKIVPEDLKKYINDFYSDENHEHMVFPGMVYISHPTENGTLYSKSELETISEICRNNNIYLYMDGARLGYGLMSNETDVTLHDIAKLCDAFYIGGTKVGALCGEAVVFRKEVMPKHFMTIIKQHGALLAKGRLTGIQFDTLFTDNLYFKISKNAIDTAEMLKKVLEEKGLRFAWDSPTNQQFVILENSQIEKLKEKVGFSFWEKYDDNHTVVRFATSWSTTKENIENLKNVL